MKSFRQTIVRHKKGVAVAAAFLLAYVFFQFTYPYHLIRREQMALFLFDWDYIIQTYHGTGWMSRFVSDFLEQFFLLPAAGPFTISLLLTVIALVVYRICNRHLNQTAILIHKVGSTSNAGSKLRSTSGWVDKGSGNGTDNYGFTALPAGGKYLEETGFADFGAATLFWSTTYQISSTLGDTSVYALDLSSYNNEARLDYFFSSSVGYSLRCLKD